MRILGIRTTEGDTVEWIGSTWEGDRDNKEDF